MKPIVLEKENANYMLVPQYRYTLTGELLISDDYWFGPMAEVSPLDLSIGWGYLTHPKVKRNLVYSHGDRFYRWRFRADAPAKIKRARAYVITHSSNNHIIPANDRIEYGLTEAGVGETIKLKGLLVDVLKYDENRELMAEPWRTSTHRRDYGASGCEIIYVTEARINNKRYTSSFDLTEHKK
jgi:hypothetical protein